MKSLIMKNAWKIAKEASSNFGGSAKQYLSESLKIAWVNMYDEIDSWYEEMTTDEVTACEYLLKNNDIYNGSFFQSLKNQLIKWISEKNFRKPFSYKQFQCLFSTDFYIEIGSYHNIGKRYL